MGILTFLESENIEKYPYEEAEQSDVVGSSTMSKNGKVHWKPVKRTPDFDPLNRAKDWTEEMHKEFNKIAPSPSQNNRLQRFIYSARNLNHPNTV